MIVYRAKGKKYVAAAAAVLAALLILAVAGAILIGVAGQIILGAILIVLAAAGLIWTLIEVFSYKLVLDEEGLTLSENRVLVNIKQDKIRLKYEGLCEIKYTTVSSDSGANARAIALFYSDGVFRFLNVKRFSIAQINSIMSDIKRLTEAKIGREVKIFDSKNGGVHGSILPG